MRGSGRSGPRADGLDAGRATSATRARALVVGAGIAGLAAVRALAHTGFSVEIIERSPTPNGAGGGIYLPGNAARALRALGLDAEVAQRGVEISRQRFLDDRGLLLTDVDVARLWAQVGPCLGVDRAALHAVLREGVGDTTIRHGVTLNRCTQRDGKVEAELSDGSQGEYDLVVGADGIHSAVRRLTFNEAAPPCPLRQTAWRLRAPCPEAVTTWTAMLGRRTVFLVMPIGQGQAYAYCDLDTDSVPDRPADLLPELLSDFVEPAQEILDSVADVHVSTIEEVVLPSWVRGQVVLIGDAAHATSPTMAEGAAMALEDAVVLAQSLTANAAIRDALAAFERRRRPRTDWVRAQTRRRDRIRRLPPPARNLMLRAVGPRIFRANYAPLLAHF